jgi:hypothetical protein
MCLLDGSSNVLEFERERFLIEVRPGRRSVHKEPECLDPPAPRRSRHREEGAELTKVRRSVGETETFALTGRSARLWASQPNGVTLL